MTLKISISGVRGIVPESLTPEVCLNFAKAFGTYLDGGKVVVGTDPRPSSEYLKGIVFSGLLSCGCKIIDLGICPTPTVGIMVRELQAAGGTVITASHNPLPWNGLKFIREDGIFLNENQARKLIKIYESKQFSTDISKGVELFPSAIGLHIQKILRAINPFRIRLRKFKVALDACNGAGSFAMIKLLEKLGCKVFPIHCNLKLPFPHNPEPIPENLGELMHLVKEKKADLGLALDSDADRLSIVSEEGKALGEELTLALCVNHILEKNKSKSIRKKIVVVNLSTSQVIEDLSSIYGAKVIRTKVGEVHVAEEIKSLKALIGGEGNGGVIYPKIGFNRDSLTAAALILNYLSSTRKKISELAENIPKYQIIKTKIECQNLDEAWGLIEKVKNIFRKEPQIVTEGVKILFPKAWLHVRASNTEPVVRIIAEAKTKKEAEELIKKATAPATTKF